jgi:prefoldin subunit 5
MTITIDMSGVTGALGTMNGHLETVATAMGSGQGTLASKLAQLSLDLGLLQIDFNTFGAIVQGVGINVGVITGLSTVETWLESLDSTIGVTNERLQAIDDNLELATAAIGTVTTELENATEQQTTIAESSDAMATELPLLKDRMAAEGDSVAAAINTASGAMTVDLGTLAESLGEDLGDAGSALTEDLTDLGTALGTNVGDRIAPSGEDDLSAVLALVGLSVDGGLELVADRVAPEDDSVSAAITDTGDSLSEGLQALTTGIFTEGGDSLSLSLEGIVTGLTSLQTSFETQTDLEISAIADVEGALNGEDSSLYAVLTTMSEDITDLAASIENMDTTGQTLQGNLEDISDTLTQKLENLTLAVVGSLASDYDWDMNGQLINVVGHLVNIDTWFDDSIEAINDLEAELFQFNNQMTDIDLVGPQGNILHIRQFGPPFAQY